MTTVLLIPAMRICSVGMGSTSTPVTANKRADAAVSRDWMNTAVNALDLTNTWTSLDAYMKCQVNNKFPSVDSEKML